MAQCTPFSITGEAMLDITEITGPASASIRSTAAVFVATIKNSGTTSGSGTVTFYEGISGTIISVQGTSMIEPGGTQTLSITINPSIWTIGDYEICAKMS